MKHSYSALVVGYLFFPVFLNAMHADNLLLQLDENERAPLAETVATLNTLTERYHELSREECSFRKRMVLGFTAGGGIIAAAPLAYGITRIQKRRFQPVDLAPYTYPLAVAFASGAAAGAVLTKCALTKTMSDEEMGALAVSGLAYFYAALLIDHKLRFNN